MGVASRKVTICLIAVLVLGGSALMAAEKTDVVVLRNGDRITGEVKELVQGRLELKTDSMETIYIQWDAIAQVTSDQHLEVEMETGEKFFGPLSPAPEAGSRASR